MVPIFILWSERITVLNWTDVVCVAEHFIIAFQLKFLASVVN